MFCEEEKDLLKIAMEKIKLGKILLERTNQFNHLDGISKVQRKIRQELKFLKRINCNDLLKKEYLQCSNLTHYAALVDTIVTTDNCVAVNKTLLFDNQKIVVDIIYNGGLNWIKVIARNPKSIRQLCLGNGGYGVRTILDHAEDYLRCAEANPCLFQTPKVKFVFSSGIYCDLAQQLESLGIKVEGKRLTNENVDNIVSEPNIELRTIEVSQIRKVNLDVSAMLAFVSSVTNGSCLKYKLHTRVLQEQADREAQYPVKPTLDKFFKDKTLYCCKTAEKSFLDIVNTVGGPNEKLRAEEFLKNIIVLPDESSIENNLEESSEYFVFNNVQFLPNKPLKVGGKIRERSLIIFTFGDRIQAVTVTANDGFVRAAKQQGINFVVFVHESRALTEQKELKAETLP